MHFVQSTLLVSLILFYSLKKKSLTISGCIGATIVGYSTFLNQYILCTLVLLSFFFSSSIITKFQAKKKTKLEKDFTKGAQRDIVQVFCNGFVGSLCSILFMLNQMNDNDACLNLCSYNSFFILCFIGHYACCCGDTWASELGILNNDWPYLITTFEQVPPGTNGAISLLGTLASLMGGQLIGLIAALGLRYQYPQCGFKLGIIGLGMFAGLFGSLLDSLLGATLQPTYYDSKKQLILSKYPEDIKEEEKANIKLVAGRNILDNNMVNFITSIIISLLTGVIGNYILKV